MQPATPAAFDISLSPDAAGANAPVTLRFDDSGTHLFVSRYQQLDAPNWLLEHAIDLSGSALLVILLLLLALVLRVLRRPQLLGHLHCRRCNYDLTRLDHPIPSLCTECGTSTAAHPPRPGASLSRRLLLPLGTLVPLLILAALTFNQFCESPRPGNTAWPFDAMRRVVPFWPFARVTPALASGMQHFVYPLSASATAPPRPFTLRGELPLSSPDGNTIAWCQFDQLNNWAIQAHFASLATGNTRTVTLGTNADGFPKAQGFTPDGREALFTLSSLVQTPPSDPAATSTPITVTLLAVAASDGAVRKIGSAPTTALRASANSWNVPHVLAAMDASGSWAMLARHTNATGNIVLTPLNGQPTDVPLTPSRGGTSDTLMRFLTPTTLITDTHSVDATTGALLPTPQASVTWSARYSGIERATLLRSDVPTNITLNFSVSQGDVNTGQLCVSPDGRWAAAEIYATVGTRIDTIAVRVWSLPAPPSPTP